MKGLESGCWDKRAIMAIELMLAQGNDEQTVAFAVLALTRVFYQLKTGKIARIEQASQFALQALPQEWCTMIEEALRIHRTKLHSSFLTGHEYWVQGAKAFARYLHDYSDKKRPAELIQAATS